MKKILFVCLGNICRSPAAEAVFKKMLHEQQCEKEFLVDSAGTGSWHCGELPDSRMRSAATCRGLELNSRARQIKTEDFDSFDFILAMDRSNLHKLEQIAPSEAARNKLSLMCHWAREYSDDEVPDPYYGGPQGFEFVLDLLEDSCAGFLAHLNEI